MANAQPTLEAFIVPLERPKPGAQWAIQVRLTGQEHAHRHPLTLAFFDTKEEAEKNIDAIAQDFCNDFNQRYQQKIFEQQIQAAARGQSQYNWHTTFTSTSNVTF